MLTATKLAKFFADRDKELLKFLRQYVEDEPPPRELPPPKPPLPHTRYKPGSMEWYRLLPPPPSLAENIRAGRAISMNAMIRDIPKTRPPRKPGQQRLHTNGRWSWWKIS